MKAVRRHEFGGPEVLRWEEVPRPVPGPTEVLVRVRAGSVNPVDVKTRAGSSRVRKLPLVLGWDVAGEVVELGAGVTRFSVGDEVLGMPWFPRPAGAYAEYVTSPSRQLVRKPATMDPTAAGCLPLAGLTAWQTLVDVGRVTSGDRVLVHAAAGGVGHLAVQIAKARGAYVIGTASAENHPLLRKLGIDAVIDHRTTRFEDATDQVDLVLDLVGGETSRRSVGLLRPGGCLISVPSGTTGDLSDEAGRRGARWSDFLVEPDQVGLEGLTALVTSGRLEVVVSAAFPLAAAADAHRAWEGAHGPGKIALTA
ncbi:NADP-dependent oxidoreductase [Amycolatopsis sp. NPDC049253]|uniref:NADP-dependent oxidoreductase n=1 Tax=Amycolatopsis sp. NPDC049253 TaxID=3155274 RepID=UPI00343AD489